MSSVTIKLFTTCVHPVYVNIYVNNIFKAYVLYTVQHYKSNQMLF